MRYRRMRVSGGIYFFTLVTYDRRRLFVDDANIEVLLHAVEHVRARHPFEIDAYVVLPEHIHMIWTLPDGDHDFSTRWMLIKSASTRFLKKRLGDEARIWQNRFWEHLIGDERDFSNHVEYVHYNPVHHGYVAAPSEWPHSSFHAFVARGDYDADWGRDAMPEMKVDRRSE